MSSYWNFVTRFVSGTLAKAEDINSQLDGVDAGFDAVETAQSKSITVSVSPGVVAIPLTAIARANKLISFDSNGDVAATTIMGDWKGDHANAAGTAYQIRDVVKDAAGSLGQDNLYICIATHTSTGSLSTDTANWELLVDVEAVAASETAAAASAAAAAASYDAFDDRYLGSFTTAAEPTLDNDGDALLTGALYFNTTLNRMKVYNGSAWQLTTANAVDVVITDTGTYYTGTEVETALQEAGASITAIETKTDNITVTQAVDLDAMETKTNHITVTQAVNLDTMESNIATNNAKQTNVSTALSVGTVGTTTVGITSDGGADDVIIPAATASTAGLLTTAKWAEIVANTAKATNVSTALSVGTVTTTTVGITSDGGADDVIIPAATVSTAGLLTTAKWAEIVANNSKISNVSTQLSVGTVTTTTVGITSDGGANDVIIPAATVSTAGLLTTAKWAEIVANTAKVTNATHTGQVTGATALSLTVSAVTAQPASGALIGTDTLIVNDGGVLSEATMAQLATYVGSATKTYNYTLQTGTSYTAAAGDFVVASNTGATTITLPAGHSVDDQIAIKKTGATGIVTIDANASETIDGELTFDLTGQYQSISLISDGTNWLII